MSHPEVLIPETSANLVDMPHATRIVEHILPLTEAAIFDKPTPQITTMKQGTTLVLQLSALTPTTSFRSRGFLSQIILHQSPTKEETGEVLGKTLPQKHLINDLSRNSWSTVYVGFCLRNQKRTRFLHSRLVQVSISFVVII
jgi:hypothetical protein